MSVELARSDTRVVELFAGETRVRLEAATKIAEDCAKVITERELYTRIGDKNHIEIEGWQTLGAMTDVFATKDPDQPVIALPWPELGPLSDEPERPGPEPSPKGGSEWMEWEQREQLHARWRHAAALRDARAEGLTFGYSASYVARKYGQVIGSGDSQCDRTEWNWTSSPNYALRGMAQTRAHSRSLGAPLRWIVTLPGFQGFDPTPAGEMRAGAGDGAPSPPEPAPASIQMLTEEAAIDVGKNLQSVWPTVDAFGFLLHLEERLDLGGIPDLCGRALWYWAKWQARPEATGSIRAQDGEPGRHPPEVVDATVVDDSESLDDTTPEDGGPDLSGVAP